MREALVRATLIRSAVRTATNIQRIKTVPEVVDKNTQVKLENNVSPSLCSVKSKFNYDYPFDLSEYKCRLYSIKIESNDRTWLDELLDWSES